MRLEYTVISEADWSHLQEYSTVYEIFSMLIVLVIAVLQAVQNALLMSSVVELLGIPGYLTLKVLNFWKFPSYCSLKPLWSGMGEVAPARTSPTLHPHPLPLCINCRD